MEVTVVQPQLLDDLLSLRLLFVTGKGGIGKTLLASGLGQYAASQGKKVLLVESSTRDQIAPLFGIDRVGHNETQVAKGLSCINLNSWENFREYVTKHLKQKMLFDKIFSHHLVQTLLKTIPGFGEVIMLGRLYYSCQLAPPPRYDLVIFDGYASGHFLSLMTTPVSLINTGFGGPLVQETTNVLRFLEDKEKCGTVFVATPEDLVISESLDFVPQLVEKSPSRVRAMILNRLVDMEQTTIPGAPHSSEYMQKRVASDRRALDRLITGLADLHRCTDVQLPLLTVKDMGFIKEPLKEEFCREWIGTSQLVESP